ncbi:MAG: glutamyl-tRNA reductase [Candidatus Omnitrophota bacterium]|nr:glutamyl-tRNA reductase [Candidatus Omnitrophota bacterium]
MSFIVVGTNYKYSPIELREKIYFSKSRIGDALQFLKERSNFKAAVILSTCNRVEIYASIEDTGTGIKEIEDFISRYHEIESKITYPYLYRYSDKEAIKHLLSVVCGLDSLILGETQILAQAQSSLFESESAGFADEFLREIFYYAFHIAKKIHTETKINEGEVSVGSVTIDFIKEKIGSITSKNILIIGVGKVTELLLKYLDKEGSNVVFVSNRTFKKAEELAQQIKAKAVRLDDLKQFLKNADIVITATSSPHFIIRKESLDEIKNHKLLILDLAVPRDVDPQLKQLKNVDLFYLEDLKYIIERNAGRKIKEVQEAENFLEIEAKELWQRITKLEPESAISP